MGKTRYFHVWARYHDTAEDLIDHFHVGSSKVEKVVLYEAMEPGSLTGSAEIFPGLDYFSEQDGE
jgi:hypothetical protein